MFLAVDPDALVAVPQPSTQFQSKLGKKTIESTGSLMMEVRLLP